MAKNHMEVHVFLSLLLVISLELEKQNIKMDRKNKS